MPKAEDPLVRFWRKVFATDDGCWLWSASVSTKGYARLGVHRRVAEAYRFAYERLVGPLPQGKEIDHLCRNRLCCNPAHLEPVTRRENIHRSPINFCGINAKKTHCDYGHPLTAENVWLNKEGNRHCKKCNARRAMAYRKRRAA